MMIKNKISPLSIFVKERRKLAGLTQKQLAEKAGLGLRFVRELEQGKMTLKLNKINQLLSLFGHEVGPVVKQRDFSDE